MFIESWQQIETVMDVAIVFGLFQAFFNRRFGYEAGHGLVP
jgi:hypothetical protein